MLLVAVVGVLIASVAPVFRESDEERAARESRPLIRAMRELELATRDGDCAAVRRLLAEEIPASSFHSRRAALLTQCIARGQEEMLEVLLEAGPDPQRSAAGVGGPSYLEIVSQGAQPPVVQRRMFELLLEHGACATAPSLMDSLIAADQNELAELASAHGAAFGPREFAAFNRLRELKAELAKSPELLRQRMRPYFAGDGPMLLGIALEKGHREMAMYLITAGAPLDSRETQGQTLLHKAVYGGDAELVRELLAKGLDVNAGDDYGDTPLSHAAYRSSVEAVRLLIQAGADLNVQGMLRNTALHHCVRMGRKDLVPILVDAGADWDLRNQRGESPRDLAARLEDQDRRARNQGAREGRGSDPGGAPPALGR